MSERTSEGDADEPGQTDTGIAEPDTDRPKTDGARHNHTQTDRETLRHIGKRASRQTETKARPTKYRKIIIGNVISPNTVRGESTVPYLEGANLASRLGHSELQELSDQLHALLDA